MTAVKPTVDTAKAGRREWIGLGVLALPTLLVSMDLTVLFLAVPALSADLKPSGSQLLWITDIYGFLMAAALITMGTLGDRIGRRRLLLTGATVFGATSLLAAQSTSPEMLIVTRALLGVAAATLLPSTLALIRNMFHDPAQRTSAIGLWTATFALGGLLGPLIGGVMIEHYGWASVFAMAVPIMLLLLGSGPLLLPEFRDPRPGRFDLVSAVLSLAGTLALVYGIKRAAQDGMGLLPLLCVMAALALGFLFVRRQLAGPEPLLDLRLFAVPGFTGALVANMVAIFAWMGTLLFIAQYLQLVLGLSPLAAGLWTMPSAGASVLGCLLAPVIARRVRSISVLISGLLVTAVGLCLLAQVTAASGLGVLVPAALISAGVAVVLTMGTDTVIASVPPAQAGAASAISETCTEVGGAFGIAVLGSIGAAAYRGALFDVDFAGTPLEAMRAARTTLAGSIEAAKLMPPEIGVNLVATARQAFVHTLALAAGIATLVVLVTTGVVGVLLPRRRAAINGSTHHGKESDMTPTETPRTDRTQATRFGHAVASVGQLTALYGVVAVLLLIGGLKFTAIEAEAVRPLISSTPLLRWMYSIMSTQQASNALGVVEIFTGLLLAAAPWSSRAGVAGGLLGSLTFLITASLLLTVPSWEAALGGFPALNAIGSFLIKDIVLLGAVLGITGKSLLQSRSRHRETLAASA